MEKVKEFHGLTRISFKQKTTQGDVFYTFEYGETVEDDEGFNPNSVEYEEAKKKMWERVDNEVSSKVKEVLKQ